MSKKVIGIDLGTSTSSVATIEGGKAVIITNSEGGRTTPSVVSLKDGERVVGAAANRKKVMNPKETVSIIKRFMGIDYNQSIDVAKHVSYNVVNVDGKPRVDIGGRKYSPEEISSFIVNKMKQTAEDYLGEKVTDAVITCPAWFDSAAREATKLAGEMCGLNVLRIVNEPTAAILASDIDTSKGDYTVLVADIGGGTTDFSLCEVSNGMIETKASYGDVFLGGNDFDTAIVQMIIDDVKKDFGVDISQDDMAKQRVYEAAEKAKIELTSMVETEINLPYLTVTANGPVNYSTKLTRAKFDNMTSSLVKRVIECGKKAVSDAKKSYKDIDYILLVGGQSRSLAIQEALSKEFGVELNKSVNPDEAVAIGAAMQANIIVGGEGSSDILLLDVTPLNLGIETLGGVMTNLIEANTTIPARKTEVFTTATDNQTAVTINVLQGCRPMAKDNKSIGMFNLEGIMPAKKGVPKVEVTFDINANGILSVSAKDQATGKEQKVTIESKSTLSDAEVERLKKEAEEHAAEDEKAKKDLEDANKCEGLIYTITQMVETAGDKLSDEDKQFFEEKKAALNKMKEDKSFGDFGTIENDVQGRMYEISAKLYGANADATETVNQAGGAAETMKDMFGGTGNPFDNVQSNG